MTEDEFNDATERERLKWLRDSCEYMLLDGGYGAVCVGYAACLAEIEGDRQRKDAAVIRGMRRAVRRLCEEARRG